MSLPVLQLPVHQIELPVTKQKIQFNPFVIKEEKSLLTTIQSENKEEIAKLFKMLIERCVLEEGFDVMSMNMVDFFYLLINIRMKSTSELIEGKLPCKKCGKDTQFEANLEKSIIVENADRVTAVVTVNDDLILNLKVASISSFFEKEDTNIADIIAHSIKTVVYKDKVYEEFTPEEAKKNIIFNLIQPEIEKVAEGIGEMIKLKVKFDYICINCAHKNTHESEDVVNFF